MDSDGICAPLLGIQEGLSLKNTHLGSGFRVRVKGRVRA